MINQLIISALLSLTLNLNDTDKAVNEKETSSYSHSNTKLFYSSGWETISTWSSTNAGGSVQYSYNTSIKNNKDFVLVFIKGYDFEGFSKTAVKPLALPFYIMPSTENSFNAFTWASNTQGDQLSISIKMANDLNNIFQTAKQKVEFRYFTVSKDLLKEKKITEQDLRKSSYQQIINLLGVQE